MKIAKIGAKLVKKFLAKYDLLEDRNKRLRRRPEIETKGEDDILSEGMQREKGINLLRDLERNYTQAKSNLRQFRLNVVGTGPKIHINIEDDRVRRAADWFNGVYAKDCDSLDDTPLNEICMNILTAVKREGDVVVSFDDYDEDDGRLRFWEADQLVNIRKSDWEKQTDWINKDGTRMEQKDGIVYNNKGRVMAYVVTSERGIKEAKMEDVSILPRGTAKLLKAPWRLTQRRGSAELLTPASHYLDAYEMLSSELQSAKLASKIAGKVKRKDMDETASEIFGANGINVEELLSTTTASGEEDESDTVEDKLPIYERYEKLVGGYMHYLDEGDDFEIVDFNRPNVHLADFLDRVNSNAGASLGLAKVYSTLQATTSYTAFRGEMLLSWAQFYVDQKWLERRFMDWLVRKAINWAVRKRILKPLPAGWETKISMSWPQMPIVDPEKLEKSIAKALKNGRTNYEKILGPQWREILKSYAEQIKLIRELELPLEVLETKSGGMMTPT